MNAQERKYIAKRISDVEEATIRELNAKPNEAPIELLKRAVSTLTQQQLTDLILRSIPSGRKEMLALISSNDTEYHYSGGSRYSGTSYGTKATVNAKLDLYDETETLPNGFRYADAVKAFETNIARRKATIEKIETTAARCRDKAMLGEGTAALQAFDDFAKQLRKLLDE